MTALDEAAQTYPAAVELERLLGDPRNPTNPFGFDSVVARDSEAKFPEAFASEFAQHLGLSFVPSDDGGQLSTMDETLTLARLVSRRDGAAMPATMFSVTGAGCVLLAGNAQQRKEVVRLLAAGGVIGFAMAESAHGSDLLANECRLDTGDAGGFRLNGRKWLAGIGDRCDALVVVARTGERGPAAFTAVLLTGEQLAAVRRDQPKRTSGMRGIDSVGVSFDDVEVPAGCVIGGIGRGVEIALKVMQFVRVLSTAANLGCADTGLRLAMDFAGEHRFGGRLLAEHAQPRRALATAAALLLACDAVALSASRAMHVLPATQCLWSGIAKRVATDLSAEVFALCSDVLGARSLLHDGPFAAFDIARRDNVVVRHIDTAPDANLWSIATLVAQFPASAPEAAIPDEVAATFRLGDPLGPVRLDRLDLALRGMDPVTAGFPGMAAAAVAELAGHPAAARVKQVNARLSSVIRAMHRVRARGAPGDPQRLDLAARFCWLHAAASCVFFWWFNRQRCLYSRPAGSPGWLSAALSVLLDRASDRTPRLDAHDTTEMYALVENLHTANKLFSAVPLVLGWEVRSNCER
ncbi:acyl-CoA dehydrogenase [Saccharopolyspora sp. K220]|uniref:acyl-CoA dehydrogenase n=1 Tax=Saccharopolyspora soli TaxID=2926618 RepID=UPI001F576400|nr:acyl-CoA dehydrogenase [Saccharopolyspora soli]MCI2416130.1 acyl-CoA dehydrogenase [Saccharopolyspora soli]